MYQSIKTYCSGLVAQFDHIPAERKKLLEELSSFIREKQIAGAEVKLVYICTHNSRRSHFGQIWAHVAAHYYGLKGVKTFSGGTEATAFHPNAIDAIKRIGFNVHSQESTSNPKYKVAFDSNEDPLICFSKVYNAEGNPGQNFAAIMTCSDAEENCPYIPGADFRIALTYDDPKAFDNTAFQNAKYDERCRQIALECFYVFSKVNT